MFDFLEKIAQALSNGFLFLIGIGAKTLAWASHSIWNVIILVIGFLGFCAIAIGIIKLFKR